MCKKYFFIPVLIVATIVFLFGYLFWKGFARVEEVQRILIDTQHRLDTVEAVYESSECVLSTEEDGGCLLNDGRFIFLGTSDRDGEIRWLRVRDENGKEARAGQLSSDASYVRLHREGKSEGFMSDTLEGWVEVYAARPALDKKNQDERLPIMMKKIPQNE